MTHEQEWSLRDGLATKLEGNGNGRIEMQAPPHPDEMEHQVLTEMSSLLFKQTTLAAQQMGEMHRTQKVMTAHLEDTAKVADVALRLFTETLVEIRLYNEEGNKLMERLVDSHKQLGLLAKQQKQ